MLFAAATTSPFSSTFHNLMIINFPIGKRIKKLFGTIQTAIFPKTDIRPEQSKPNKSLH